MNRAAGGCQSSTVFRSVFQAAWCAGVPDWPPTTIRLRRIQRNEEVSAGRLGFSTDLRTDFAMLVVGGVAFAFFRASDDGGQARLDDRTDHEEVVCRLSRQHLDGRVTHVSAVKISPHALDERGDIAFSHARVAAGDARERAFEACGDTAGEGFLSHREHGARIARQHHRRHCSHSRLTFPIACHGQCGVFGPDHPPLVGLWLLRCTSYAIVDCSITEAIENVSGARCRVRDGHRLSPSRVGHDYGQPACLHRVDSEGAGRSCLAAAVVRVRNSPVPGNQGCTLT